MAGVSRLSIRGGLRPLVIIRGGSRRCGMGWLRRGGSASPAIDLCTGP